jgi:hypothetical protein
MIGASRLTVAGRSSVRSSFSPGIRGALSHHHHGQTRSFTRIPNNRLTTKAIVVGFVTKSSRFRGSGVLAYSTERILQLRSGRKDTTPKTVYNAKYETENCGVGLVASLQSIPSRRVVEDADEMLVRMSHRGGCGCDPASGDGAGISSYFVAHHDPCVSFWFLMTFISIIFRRF